MKNWIIEFLIKKYALGWLVKGYQAIEGKKTTIVVTLAIIAWLCEVFGVIPKETAATLYSILGPAGAVTFLEKLKRYQKLAENMAEGIKKGAVRG